jgi:predicted sugar kinase
MSKIREENATCIVCGKKYHLCIACERSKATWQPWKMIADTENCYNIYNVINDYKFNKISKDEARNLLKELDLNELNSFKESSKKVIKEILATKKGYKPTKVKEITEEVKELTEEIKEITEEVTETTEVKEIIEEVKEENYTEENFESVEEKSFEDL